MYVFLCEDNIDGIFTAIYDAWASHFGHKNIYILSKEPQNYELFCEYISVKTNMEKSQKVSNTIKTRCGHEVWIFLCQAAMAYEKQTTFDTSSLSKADALYRTLLYAFSMEKPEHIIDCLQNPYVLYLFELSRSVSNEAHHLLGFVRFKELQNHVLFAKIHPKNLVLPILGDHFSDRLPQENFMIYDENRNLAVIHRKGFSDFILVGTENLDKKILEQYSEDELEYEKLWCGFFSSITIEARINPKLQNQNIPKRFQKDAVEFS
ncbi:MAG: TIGR03915 family putative DNA repair protein [Lachnospiraceae bacterium]|nr:TIGR03915 family putative DNA repair protein [Lachnospiraceae bacterium]